MSAFQQYHNKHDNDKQDDRKTSNKTFHEKLKESNL